MMKKHRCAMCGHRNPYGSRYCRECGRAFSAARARHEVRSYPEYTRSPLARAAWAGVAIVLIVAAYLLGGYSR